VTPHHLFFDEADAARLGPLGDMRPLLATPADVDALWGHIDSTIDCIATDHAPHTLDEKYGRSQSNPPPGVAGLETSLPLMLTAVHEGRLSIGRLVELMSSNPRRIFNLPDQPDTKIEVDSDATYTLSNDNLYTKCGWTPFAGMTVRGRVHKVILRGQTVFEEGQLQAQLVGPATGRLIPTTSNQLPASNFKGEKS
jgi:carbamoyl-phosphate synthase/aspartate carbamoyltransferase/dihydroorotase